MNWRSRKKGDSCIFRSKYTKKCKALYNDLIILIMQQWGQVALSKGVKSHSKRPTLRPWCSPLPYQCFWRQYGGRREEKCWLHRSLSRRFSFFPDSFPLSHGLPLRRTGHGVVSVVHARYCIGSNSTTPNCTDVFMSIHLGSQSDCGSDHELLTAKFRLKLKKVGKTTRPFR